MLKKAIYIIGLLIGTMIPMSCVDDQPEVESGDPAIARFSIRARSQAKTRADGVPKDPADNEKINDWFILVVPSGGEEITQVVTRSATGAVEEENFTVQIPGGTYDLYAFANITRIDLLKGIGVEIADDATEADITAALNAQMKNRIIEKAAWATNLNKWDISKNIPMSGYLKGVTIKNTIEENFSIEVVRMMAKIQFAFTNNSGAGLTVNSVEFEPVTNSEVTLFPNLPVLGTGPLNENDFPTTPTTATIVNNCNIVLGTGESDKTNETLYFYLQESVSNLLNNKFKIRIKVTDDAGNVRDFYNAPTSTIEYINRNDWIYIPVKFSEWFVEFTEIGYPPIGGYPVGSGEADGEAHYFSFSTAGEFMIASGVIKDSDKANGTNNYLRPGQYTLSIEKFDYYNLDGSPMTDPNSSDKPFFTKNISDPSSGTPEIINDGEWIVRGYLGNKPGMARLKMKITITATNTVITRYIYIIRKNPDTP